MKLVFRNSIKILFLLLLPSFVFGQNDTKIQKKLDKLYSKGKYEKVELVGSKLQKKYGKSDIIVLYNAKASYALFKGSTSYKTRWSNLKKATINSLRLPADYDALKLEVKEGFREFISQVHNQNRITNRGRLAVDFYKKYFKETHELYAFYHKETKKSSSVNYKVPATNAKREKLLKYATKFIGTPYKYAGETPKGFDCSGFVKYVYKSIDVELPHNAHMISKLKARKMNLKKAQPGDLVFFGSGDPTGKYRTNHVGIIFSNENGNTQVIHCPSRGVTIDGENGSWEHYWKERVLFVKGLDQISD